MLQRSWTVEQEHDANAAGAVYVGKATFRMGSTPTHPSTAIFDSDDDVFAAERTYESSGVLARVPTERIVLLPGSVLEPARVGWKRTSAGTRRSVLISFSAAFVVGVVCTMGGQVALHWRARRSSATSVDGLASQVAPTVAPAAAPASLRTSPVLPAATATSAKPSVAEAGVASPPRAGSVVVEPVSALADPTPAAAEKPSIRPDGAAFEPRPRPHGQHRAAPGSTGADDGTSRRAISSRKAEHEKVDWVDPFAGDESGAADIPEEAADARVGAATGGNRPVRRAPRGHRWVDPFAD